MRRVAIVGCIGSGKSTMACTLGDALDLPVIHLDRLWWKPGPYKISGAASVAAHTMDRHTLPHPGRVDHRRGIMDPRRGHGQP